MYLRHATIRKDGKVHRYWRLVRSVRVGRRVIQQTVAHLGELDGQGRVEARSLARRLIGTPEQARLFNDGSEDLTIPVRLKGLRIERSRQFGDVYLALALWRGTGLEDLCEQLLSVGKERVAWAKMAAVLVGAPKSELKKFASELARPDGWRMVHEGVEVKLTRHPETEETVILCRSADRRSKERAMHDKFSRRIEEALARLAARIARSKKRIDPAMVLKTIKINVDATGIPARLATKQEIENDEAVLNLTKQAEQGRWLVLRAQDSQTGNAHLALPANSIVNVFIEPGTSSAEGTLVTEERQQFSFITYGPLRLNKSNLPSLQASWAWMPTLLFYSVVQRRSPGQ